MFLKKNSALIALLSKPPILLLVYIIIVAGAGIQTVMQDILSPFKEGSYDFILHSSMNNYTIYQDSFFHLLQHKTMYDYHWSEYYDLYLYSPSFPFLIMPFAILQKYIGVVLWCVFNGLILFYAVRLLKIEEKKKVFILWFILIELLTSIQNVQVNPTVAALFILAFVAFERKKVGLAALIIASSMFIKIFGIVGVALFILYPQRLKFIGYMIFWSCIIFLSPLIFISWGELMKQYYGWYTTVINLHSKNEGDFSAMQLLASNLHFTLNDLGRYAMQAIAVVLFCIKYIRYKSFIHPQYRLLFLSSILIWTTIFNNAVESPSFIIAITGVAIWYIADEKSKLNLGLLIFALILTSLSHSDLFPRYIRDHYVDPFALKSLPCFLIWLKVEYELIFRKRTLLQPINA